jgi:hypothetical protein
VYSDGQFGNGSITGVQYTNNVLSPGSYGYAVVRGYSIVWSGNTDASTRQTVSIH